MLAFLLTVTTTKVTPRSCFSKQERTNLVNNLAGDLGKVKDSKVMHKMLSHFYKADSEYGTRLTNAVNGDMKQVKQLAAKL